MKLLTKTTPAKHPKTKESGQIAYMYAIILVIFVVAQLFTFDKFQILLEDFSLPGGVAVSYLFSGLLVACAVFALPFLLRFKTSPLMRVVSMVCGWLVPLMWLFLTFWLVFSSNTVTNVGFLGTAITLIPGWWAIFVSIAIGILAAWSTWGLWPLSSHPSILSKK
jgi:hypothetical protein